MVLPKIIPGLLKKLPANLMKAPPGFKKPNTDDFKADMEKLGEDIAEGYKEKIIENIETNHYGFVLADSTIQQKGSDIPFIDTRELIDSIYREGTVVSVEDSPRDKGDLTNKDIAIILEYGTKDKHIPARPVWRNTFEDYRDTAREKVNNLLDKGKFKD